MVEFNLDSGQIVRAVMLVPRQQDETSADRLFAGLAVGGGSVWVAGDLLDPTLYRIGASGGAVRIPVPAGTDAIAVGAGAVWLANQLADSVVRVDPRRSRVTATIRVGHEPVAVRVAGGAVWTANALDRTLSRIDVRTNRVDRTIRLDATPVALATDARRLWIAAERQ